MLDRKWTKEEGSGRRSSAPVPRRHLRSTSRSRRAYAGILFVVAASGCDSPTESTPTVRSVEVVGPTVALSSLGESAAFSAVAKDASGTPLSGVIFTWASSAPEVATVTAGLATPVGNGTTTISATAGGVSGVAELRVRQEVAQVELRPGADTVFVGDTTRYEGDATVLTGDTTRLTASVLDAAGYTVGDRPAMWTIRDSAVITIEPTGLVHGSALGSTTVVAASEGVTDSASITVFEVDQSQPTIAFAEANSVISSDQSLAQVVTIGTAGILDRVRLAMGCTFDPVDVVVDLVGVTASGEPDEAVVLLSHTFDSATLRNVPSPGKWRFLDLVFPSPITVAVDDRLAIVVGSNGAACAMAQGPLGDPYPGGDAYYTDEFGDWVRPGIWDDRWDHPFQVVIR